MKPSRNDPCPCGSGKKYKKCCLSKDQEQSSGESAWSYAGKLYRIRHADDYPIEACYLNGKWQEQGFARILVTRLQEDGRLMMGAFFVDVFCLGVKDAFCNEGLPRNKLEAELLSRFFQNDEPTRVGINYVKEIIYGAVDYARGLGFEPHADFDLARHVLGTEEFSRTRNIKFGGPEGKPLYVAGSDDNVESVLRKLRKRLGENGFHYITPGDAWETVWDDDGPQAEDNGAKSSDATENLDSELGIYKRLRQIGMDLMSPVLRSLPRQLIVQAAKDLRLLDRKQRIVCDTEDEMSFIMDRAIHDIPWPNQRFIETYYEERAAELPSDQRENLKAHIQPVFSLYEIVGTSRGRGVKLVDLFRPQELFLMDTGLGSTARVGGLLATRVLYLEGLYFTSGVSTPFGAEYKKALMSYFASLAQDNQGPGSWEKLMRRHAPYFFIEFKKTGIDVEFTPAN